MTHRPSTTFRLTLLALLLCPLTYLGAALELGSLFTDYMVLQRGRAVPVWGWADAGEQVTLSFAGQQQSATAGTDGRWELRLEPLKASSENRNLTVRAGDEVLTIQNVLVGEVWLCSGQSNMHWTLGASAQKPKEARYQPVVDRIWADLDRIHDPLLRQVYIPLRTSPDQKQERFKAPWIPCTKQNAKQFGAVGFYFAKELRRELGVPVGLIKCAWGGTRIEPWIAPEAFEANEARKRYRAKQQEVVDRLTAKWDQAAEDKKYEQLVADWRAKNPDQPRLSWRVTAKKPTPPKNRNTVPGTLYNGMVHALVPYAIKGTLWYQGEANGGHRPESYKDSLEALVGSWRNAWGQGDFPFYWAQLASFQKVRQDPHDGVGWDTVQEQQRLALSIANSGMAVLHDIGEAEDIHPRNKIEVGQRLALWALAKDYGRNELVYSGPLYRNSQFEGPLVRVRFDSVGAGLMVGKKELLKPAVASDEPLARFQICGADQQWKWAEARIVGKDVVEVSHPDITEAVGIAYAWAMNPEGANLYNRAGLPASKFRALKGE